MQIFSCQALSSCIIIHSSPPLGLRRCLIARHQKGAQFKQQVDGQENDHERERIARGRDDGGKHQQDNDSMPTVGPEKVAVQDP